MKKGFTLLELLIVIGILAILASAAVVVLNPVELLRQARDSTRTTDLKNLDKALGLYQTEGGSSFGSLNTVYVSIPDSSAACANLGLPSLPSGWSYACATSDNFRKINGSGWLPVNFNSISIGSPLAALPIDPINSISTGNYYTYVTGSSWVLAGILESEKYLKQTALKDGGTDDGRYEVGTNLQLWSNATGLVGYWKLDESSGTTASDSSDNGNTGALINDPTWTSGKVNGALSFDGSNDYVNVGSAAYFTQTPLTYTFWFNPSQSKLSSLLHRNDFLYLYQNNLRISIYFSSTLYSDIDTGNIITLSTWQHLAFTIDANYNSTLYFNGVQVTSGTSISRGTTGNFYIANTVGDLSRLFNGLIDEVRIYNRALSAAEIAANYNATK